MINRLILIILFINPFFVIARELSDSTFADYLFREGEYYRAITEYYRMLYASADYSERAELLGKVGLCYFQGEDYDGYISFFKKNREIFSGDSLRYIEMNLYLGKSYYHLNHYRDAIKYLESLPLNPRNHFFSQYQFLLGISYSRIYDPQNAIAKLQLISQSDSGSDKIIASHLIRALRKFPDLSHKSPILAGGLSAIVPGAGYAYCHRWGTGFASLLINGLLAWTFSDALNHDQYGLASLTGFVGIGWYVGNIKGSANAAKKYNSMVRDDFINSVLLKENFLEYVKH
jgi:tetratricopeptide (TPR) repeat protein